MLGGCMKKVVIGVLAIVVIVAIAMIVFVGKLDGLIADAIETYGFEAAGTAVEVGEVKTNLKEGSISVAGINVSNPSKYSLAHALKISSFVAKVDYDKKEIAEIIINQPTVNAEFKGIENNFEDIMNGLPDDDAANDGSVSDDLVLTIQSLKLLSANVNLTSDKLGVQNFVMDDFVMNDIKGTSSQIAQLIVNRLTKHIADQTSGYVKKQVKQEVKKQAVSKAKEVINEKLSKGLGKFKLKLN